jgi:hypothetical protein
MTLEMPKSMKICILATPTTLTPMLLTDLCKVMNAGKQDHHRVSVSKRAGGALVAAVGMKHLPHKQHLQGNFCAFKPRDSYSDGVTPEEA